MCSKTDVNFEIIAECQECHSEMWGFFTGYPSFCAVCGSSNIEVDLQDDDVSLQSENKETEKTKNNVQPSRGTTTTTRSPPEVLSPSKLGLV